MMIMVDNNFLIELLTNKDMYRLYNQFMERSEITLGLPTPVLAEFLVKDNNFNRTDFLNKVNPFLQVFDFDKKSALMSAKIMQDLIAKDYFAKKHKDKQAIKVDIQILGISVANQVSKLLTTDSEISKITTLLNLPIDIVNFDKLEYSDLPLLKNE